MLRTALRGSRHVSHALAHPPSPPPHACRGGRTCRFRSAVTAAAFTSPLVPSAFVPSAFVPSRVAALATVLVSTTHARASLSAPVLGPALVTLFVTARRRHIACSHVDGTGPLWLHTQVRWWCCRSDRAINGVLRLRGPTDGRHRRRSETSGSRRLRDASTGLRHLSCRGMWMRRASPARLRRSADWRVSSLAAATKMRGSQWRVGAMHNPDAVCVARRSSLAGADT